MSSQYVKIKLRRDTAAEWSSRNPVLSLGEPGVETDTRKIKIGDGVKTWNQLSYIAGSDNNPILVNTNEVIDDRIANLLVPGAGITMQYDDNANLLLIGTSGLQPSGNYATLSNGTVPSAQLPSYVDDVLEYANLGSFPATGESNKIYVAVNTKIIYRWSGSTYIEISPSPGSTDSVTEGSINKYYTDVRASAAAPVQSVAGKTGIVVLNKSDVGLGNVDNTSDANKPVSTATQNALDGKANKTDVYNSAVQWTANHTLADGTRYLVNDLVYNSGKVYRAKFDNESLSTSDTTYWQDLGNGYRLNIDGRDIPNIPYPITSVNGLTGSVTIATDRLTIDDQEIVLGEDGILTYPDGTTSSGGTIITPGNYDIQSIENTLIQTSANAGAKTWTFGTDGGLTLPKGSVLSETNNTVSISPPTAAVGQSLVIRPTAATWSINSSGYIEYGSPITISVTLGNWAYFGTVNYTISGTGVTPQSLGRALTGKLTFVSTTGPDTESITWTIPANSSITEFTLTLTSVDGTRSGPEIADANLYPALYYNFEESNGMPTGQFVTVTNNGISSSEHSHVHLISGDPSTVDIYLGDDDQYVKIEKDGGDVVVGTKSEAVVNRLTLITNGTGYAVTPNDVAVLGGSGTGMRVNYANNGDSVIVVVLNTLGTGYQDGDILTLSGGNGNCTFRYNNHNAIYNNWTFGTDGRLTLPIDGDILDSNGTSVLGGGSTTVVSSSYSSTINTDAGAGDIFDITLTGNTTLANPTNPVNGKTLRWRITQDSTGNRTVTLGNKFNIPSSATSPLPFSTAANKMDMLAATYHAGRDKWDIVAFVPGY